MIDEKNRIEVLKKKVDYFFKNNISVHIALNTERWLNGKIIDVIGDGFILDEFEEGKIPIFFIEILPNGISPYKEEVEDETKT